jgi:hypothetical protein
MKIASVAGLLLAVLLSGCSGMYPDSSSKSTADSGMRSSTMVAYHSTSFGDPNNQPFWGTYPDR